MVYYQGVEEVYPRVCGGARDALCTGTLLANRKVYPRVCGGASRRIDITHG